MITRSLITIGICLVVSQGVEGQGRQAGERRGLSFTAAKVAPVDASRDDADLARLKEILLAAARAKNVSMMEPVMTDEFRLALHEFRPREAAVREMEGWGENARQTFWRDLEDALMHGLALSGPATAVAPYGAAAPVKCEFPPAHYCAVVMGTNVIVREAPRLSAPIVDTLSNELVGEMEPGTVTGTAELIGSHRYRWLKIATPSAKVEFVSEKFVARALGLTFLFRKENGQWRFAGMTSGD